MVRVGAGVHRSRRVHSAPAALRRNAHNCLTVSYFLYTKESQKRKQQGAVQQQRLLRRRFPGMSGDERGRCCPLE